MYTLKVLRSRSASGTTQVRPGRRGFTAYGLCQFFTHICFLESILPPCKNFGFESRACTSVEIFCQSNDRAQARQVLVPGFRHLQSVVGSVYVIFRRSTRRAWKYARLVFEHLGLRVQGDCTISGETTHCRCFNFFFGPGRLYIVDTLYPVLLHQT